jgi:hypothetical protein
MWPPTDLRIEDERAGARCGAGAERIDPAPKDLSSRDERELAKSLFIEDKRARRKQDRHRREPDGCCRARHDAEPEPHDRDQEGDDYESNGQERQRRRKCLEGCVLGHRSCGGMVPKMRWATAALVVGALGVTVAGAGVSATIKDRNLAAALAFWRSQGCESWAKPDTSMWEHGARFNALFGNCRAGDGHDQHVYFFDRARYVGSDGLGTSSEVLGLWRDETTFAFMYVLYRRQDPLCCPTGGGKIVRFRWNGRRFRALDRSPPRQNGNVPLGR